MEKSFFENKILARVDNFRWNFDASLDDKEKLTLWLDTLEFSINVDMDCRIQGQHSSAPELLRMSLFSEIYESTLAEYFPNLYQVLAHNSTVKNDMFEACLFHTLCQFIHTTKRIGGKSLKEFVIDNDPLCFNNPDSPNYRNPSLLDSQVDKLRKSRNRNLKQRSVYIKNIQWNAISKDSEYEWAQVFNEDTSDILKRFGNLYNDLKKAHASNIDDEYKEKLIVAYKKFSSKLKKIKYERFLECSKEIFSYLLESKEHYGINLYRFEKRMSPYKIISTVKKYLNAGNNCKEFILHQFTITKDIPFPKLCELPDPSYFNVLVTEYRNFIDYITFISCLLIDYFIDKGRFGDDWEQFFLNTINDMADSVLYDPSKIEFFACENAQEIFETVLSYPVRVFLSQHGGITDLDLNTSK